MIYKPHAYQDHATQYILQNAGAGLFMEMSLGKTVATMTAADILLNDTLEINKVLVVAPLRVAQEVWTGERDKWDHLKHLRISRALGTEAERKAALKVRADIYVINVDNVAWLLAQYGTAFPFDMLIIDESSKFKNPDTRRFKSIRKILPMLKRVVILTGTPAAEALLNLWPQLYMLDRGKRLGETLTSYRDRYFTKKENGFGYRIRKEDKNSVLGEGIYEKEIYNKIADVCISMKKEDYLTLPPRIDNLIKIKLPPDIMRKYLDFEKKSVLEILEGKEISAVNAGALCTKLTQFSNGAVYDENKVWHEVHNEKMDALEDVIEEANGQTVLVAYLYRSDLERIQHRFKSYLPRVLKTSQDFADWNKGIIQIGLIHPASASHGLNLQAGGHILARYGKSWSSELDRQLPARLDRQGQTQPVFVHDLICAETIDEDVIESLKTKEQVENALMKAVKARIKKYIGNNVNS